jgi:uncharacterized protein
MFRKKAAIDRQVRDLILVYRKVLREHDIHVTQMVLFGSHAKGDANEWSDIDLAVISPDFGRDYCSDRVRLMKLARRTSTMIEPHPLHPNDLNDRWSTLSAEIRRHGVTVT